MLFAQILQCFLVLFHLSYKLGNSLLYLSYMSCMLFSYVLQLLVDLSLFGRMLFAGLILVLDRQEIAGLILVLDLLDQLGVLLDHADRGPCFLCFLLLVFVHLLLGIDDFLFVFFHRLVRPLRFIDFLLLVTGFSLPLFIIHHLRYLYLLLFNFSRSLFNILLRFGLLFGIIIIID